MYISKIRTILILAILAVFWFHSLWLWIFLSLSFVIFYVFISKNKTKNIIIVICLLSSTYFYISNFISKFEYQDLNKNYHGQVLEIDLEKKRLILKIENNQRVRLEGGLIKNYKRGDYMEIACLKDKKPDDQTYLWYLKKERIVKICSYKVLEYKVNNKFSLWNVSDDLRSWYWLKLNSKMPVEHASLAHGMLMGDDQFFSEELKMVFRRTGVSHVVAASGSNIIFIAIALSFIAKIFGLSKKYILGFSLFVIIFYGFIAGGNPPIIRAIIFFCVSTLGFFSKTLINKRMMCLYTAMLMLLNNPLILRYDIGFQLSFVATIAMLYGVPKFDDWLEKKNISLGFLQEALTQSLVVWFMTTPIQLYYFKSFSLVSPIVNIIIGPIVGLIMIFLGLSLPLLDYISYFLFGSLEIMLQVIKIGAKLPWYYEKLEIPIFIIVIFLILNLLIIKSRIWPVSPEKNSVTYY